MRERPGDGGPKADQIGIGHCDTSISLRGHRAVRWANGCFRKGRRGGDQGAAAGSRSAQRALVTLPAFRQRVQT
jgi:hypothetical protein